MEAGRSKRAVGIALGVLATLGGGACSRTEEAMLEPTGPAAGTHFRDIRGRALPESFAREFRYSDSRVRIAYRARGRRRFEVAIDASGLKPHFCYQVKLEGKSERIWSTGGDDRANRVLGKRGRWWRIEPDAGPASDEEHRANAGNELYVFSGYLLFDFLVTDAKGDAHARLSSENAYDYLWRGTDRERRPDDGPPRSYVVDGSTVKIYGERAPGRAAPGQVTLPIGDYRVQLSLTEETFKEAPHARVLASDDLRFSIWWW